jgi:hypothetical protein
LEFEDSTSPRLLLCQFADKAGNVYSVPLHIRLVVIFLLRKCRGAAGSGLGTLLTFSNAFK